MDPRIEHARTGRPSRLRHGVVLVLRLVPGVLLGLLTLLVVGPTVAGAAPAPAPAPAGVSSDWTYVNPELPIGWDTCQTTLTVSYTGQPYRSFGRQFRIALTRVSQASGFTLVQVRGPADITVTWADAEVDPRLDGYVAGYAEVSSTHSDYWTSGSVVLQSDQWSKSEGRYMRATLMHELGHIIGLGHAVGKSQVMNLMAPTSTWGAGDRAGLAHLGPRGSACATSGR